MKKTVIAILFLLPIKFMLIAQVSNIKYGKVSTDELKMTRYDNDTTADAIILYDLGYTTYEYLTDNFVIQQELKQRIKILKQSAVDRATISVPYYYASGGDCDFVTNLEACSYNLQDGKVVKTKLEKKYVFIEEVNSHTRLMKFSIPNVKVGSVIEFKYNKSSNHIYDLPSWSFQTDIPIVYSNYEIQVPEYFIFQKETHGFEKIEFSQSVESQQFNIGVTTQGPMTVTCNSQNLKFFAHNMPAIKDEPFVWYKNEFIASVNFEISATHFPGSMYQPYSQTWENLEQSIYGKSDLGDNIKIRNPFKDQISVLLDTVKTEKTKIERIYSFVKDHIKWNESYSFSGNGWKDAVKNKTGDNGQINIVLLSILKSAGFTAYPVLIRRRSQGRLPFTYPSFDKLTTFIVAAQTSDGKTYYMDGSAIYGGLNMLPIDVLVDRARVLEPTVSKKWVDFTKMSRNKSVYIINSKLDKDGEMTGTVKSIHTNQLAYSYKSRFFNAKDSASFVEKYENNNALKIESMIINGKEPMSNLVEENMTFKKSVNVQGDFMYINPMVFTHLDKNPFTQSLRKLPIEFDFPYSFQLSSTIQIPDNFTVEEIPKSLKITLMDDAGVCVFQAIKDNNIIQLNYKFELNQIVFFPENFEVIKNFFAQVAIKNSELVVLKKNN